IEATVAFAGLNSAPFASENSLRQPPRKSQSTAHFCGSSWATAFKLTGSIVTALRDGGRPDACSSDLHLARLEPAGPQQWGILMNSLYRNRLLATTLFVSAAALATPVMAQEAALSGAAA